MNKRGLPKLSCHKLNQALTSCVLLVAILIGISILRLVSQLEEDLAQARASFATTAAQLQSTLQSAQAVLMSVRATAEAVRRSSDTQLGYYEAIGRRTSQLLVESTLLVRHTDRNLARLTSSTENLLHASRTEVSQVRLALENSAASANETLGKISSVVKQTDATLARANLPAIAGNLSVASKHLAGASIAAEQALGHINEVLAPTHKGFWRRLLEAFIPRQSRERSPHQPK